MSDLTKNAPSVDGISAGKCVVITQLKAGEALTAGDTVYIKNDGKVWKAVSTAKDDLTLEAGATDPVLSVSKFDGMVSADYAAGEAVTIFGHGAIFTKYATGLTAGAFYWVSDTAGKLANARVNTNDSAVAKAISTTDVLIIR